MKPTNVIHVETIDPVTTYFEFEFEPEIACQHLETLVFRGHSLTALWIHLSKFPAKSPKFLDEYIFSAIRKIRPFTSGSGRKGRIIYSFLDDKSFSVLPQ